jgi:chitin disaccharide deacetylase
LNVQSLAVQIIVNADDFGSSDDTFAATVECFEAGLLTSATIMVGMPRTDDAFAYARAHPQFSYGVHLQFVGDGTEKPLTDPTSIPALVDENGRLLPTNVVRGRALLRRIPVDQIELETVAQVEFVKGEGVPVTHVDSHRHLHKFAPFRIGLGRALPRVGLTRVRNVQDTYLRRPVEHPTYWPGPIWRRSLMRSFRTTEHFYMPTTAHDPDWHELASRLPRAGTLEVGMHPGYEDDWRDGERQSLGPFVEAVRAAGNTLIGWDAV